MYDNMLGFYNVSGTFILISGLTGSDVYGSTFTLTSDFDAVPRSVFSAFSSTIEVMSWVWRADPRPAGKSSP